MPILFLLLLAWGRSRSIRGLRGEMRGSHVTGIDVRVEGDVDVAGRVERLVWWERNGWIAALGVQKIVNPGQAFGRGSDHEDGGAGLDGGVEAGLLGGLDVEADEGIGVQGSEAEKRDGAAAQACALQLHADVAGLEPVVKDVREGEWRAEGLHGNSAWAGVRWKHGETDNLWDLPERPR